MRSASSGSPWRASSASRMHRSNVALKATTGTPSRSASASSAAMASSACAGCSPDARACSVVMPWIAAASSGIGTPGSISQVRATVVPASRRTSAAETMRSWVTSTPVVSVSNPSRGPVVHVIACAPDLCLCCLPRPSGGHGTSIAATTDTRRTSVCGGARPGTVERAACRDGNLDQ